MPRCVTMLIVLIFSASLALAQAPAPGGSWPVPPPPPSRGGVWQPFEMDKTQRIMQAPGHFDGCASEVSRLNDLIATQNTKIQLLEEKVKLLEAQLKKVGTQ